ncbi:hypothetical protein HGA88_03995 [Candidatus Roizmanbacteria bacterium]|nr:hypothetical protein [Candidatus Roizmanbacteria bacterium]
MKIIVSKSIIVALLAAVLIAGAMLFIGFKRGIDYSKKEQQKELAKHALDAPLVMNKYIPFPNNADFWKTKLILKKQYKDFEVGLYKLDEVQKGDEPFIFDFLVVPILNGAPQITYRSHIVLNSNVSYGGSMLNGYMEVIGDELYIVDQIKNQIGLYTIDKVYDEYILEYKSSVMLPKLPIPWDKNGKTAQITSFQCEKLQCKAHFAYNISSGCDINYNPATQLFSKPACVLGN